MPVPARPTANTTHATVTAATTNASTVCRVNRGEVGVDVDVGRHRGE